MDSSSGPTPSKGRKFEHRKTVQSSCSITYYKLDQVPQIVKQERNGTLFYCILCPKSYEDPKSLQRHAEKKHPVRSTAQVASRSVTPSENIGQLSSRLSTPAGPVLFGMTRETPDQRQANTTPAVVIPLEPLPLGFAVKPSEYTILEHPLVNLPALALTIDAQLHCAICTICKRALSPANIFEHATSHNPYHGILNASITLLIDDLNLVGVEQIQYPLASIMPVFGAAVHPDPLSFCGACHQGFVEAESLRVHQALPDRCPRRQEGQCPSYQSYGQMIVHGQYKRFFPVNITPSDYKIDPSPLYADTFSQTLPAPPDFSNLPICEINDKMNLNAFLYRSGWKEAVEGYAPTDIIEATRLPDAINEPWGKMLQSATHRYLAYVQSLIQPHHDYGLTKAIAQIDSETDMTTHNFNCVQPDTQRKYGDKLCRLLFSIMRHRSPTCNLTIRYPNLDALQSISMDRLKLALDSTDVEEIDAALYDACFCLFAHERSSSQSSGRFFSPVALFLIYTSVRLDGSFQYSSEITGTCAALEYCIRATMLINVDHRVKAEEINSFVALDSVSRFLQTKNETPMSFIFNVHRVLKTIRDDEVNNTDFTFTDPYGRELSYKGHVIRAKDIKRMHDTELAQYWQYIQDEIFFGETIPDYCALDIDFTSLVDHTNNNSVGYSFIHDPRNGFDKYRAAYGQWLLSDPDRAEKYVFRHKGRLMWHVGPVLELLSKFERARDILAPGVAFSALLTTRGSEFARMKARNAPGALRNFRIDFHIPTYVADVDKTSHQHLKDHYIPHPITREWAKALVTSLAIHRPFEEFAVDMFLGDAAIQCYRFQLWPQLKSTMTQEAFRNLCGKVTERYLGVRLTPASWRSLMTAFAGYGPDARDMALEEVNYTDVSMMHTTGTASKKYGRLTSQMRGADARVTLGCIQAALNLQAHIGVGQEHPFTLGNDTLATHKDATIHHGPDTPGPATMTQATVIKQLLPYVEERVEQTVKESMADVLAAYFPAPPPPKNHGEINAEIGISAHPCHLQMLRDFLGDPNACFSSRAQAQLFALMCEGKHNVLGILGTGSGKTMMALTYAHVHRHLGKTVVVLPLSTLHDDFARRATELGVQASRWEPQGRYNSDVAVVYVAVERLSHPDFIRDIQTWSNQKQLNLVIFDEIHKVFTDKEYRSAFSDFWVLKLVNCPVIGLSGSIPPSTVSELTSLTSTTWKILRTSSNRPELGYEIRRVIGPSVVDAIVKDVPGFLAQCTGNQRIMIFCRTHDEAETLASKLGVPPFTSRTLDTNKETMKAWLAGKRRVMVSTSMLGHGIDYPGVSVVIHSNDGYTFIDQHQEESRGGRDGQHAAAITYVSSKRYNELSKVSTSRYGTAEIKQWIDRVEQCLRRIPSGFMDGVEVTCMDLPGCNLCWFCRKSLSQSPPTQALNIHPQPPSSAPSHRPVPATANAARFGNSRSAKPSLTIDTSVHLLERPLRGSATASSAAPLSSQPPSSRGARSTSSPVFSDVLALPGDDDPFFYPSRPPSSASVVEREFIIPDLPPTAGGKRSLEQGDTMQQKRVRLSDPLLPPSYSNQTPTESSSGQSASFSRPLSSTNSSFSRPRSSTNASQQSVVSMADNAAVANSLQRFRDEVRSPIIEAMRRLQMGCIICIILQKDSWHTHHHDDCQEADMGRNDHEFKEFREHLDLDGKGICWGCLLDIKQFPHARGQYGPANCPWRGILQRLIYGFSWGMYPLFTEHYPSWHLREQFSQQENVNAYVTWLFTRALGSNYPRNTYHNIYQIFLWLMKRSGVIEQ